MARAGRSVGSSATRRSRAAAAPQRGMASAAAPSSAAAAEPPPVRLRLYTGAGGALARITLCREKLLNALDAAAVEALRRHLLDAAAGPHAGAAAILLDSSTPRAFCAGEGNGDAHSMLVAIAGVVAQPLPRRAHQAQFVFVGHGSLNVVACTPTPLRRRRREERARSGAEGALCRYAAAGPPHSPVRLAVGNLRGALRSALSAGTQFDFIASQLPTQGLSGRVLYGCACSELSAHLACNAYFMMFLAYALRVFQAEYSTVVLVSELSAHLPVIALCDGILMGLGFGIAGYARHR